jgi:hypothetical protein
VGGRQVAFLCIGILVLTTGIAAAGTPENPEFHKDTVSRTETVGTGEIVRVVNPHGNVHARFGGYQNRLEVQSTEQRIEADLPELKVLLSRDDAGLDIVVGPDDTGDPSPAGFATRDRIDLVLFVPEGVVLDVLTDGGLIDVKKIRSDVSAETRTGEVRIKSIRGRARARSLRGRISATLETGATGESQDFVTETGDIEVWIGEDAHAEAILATSGEICTDFSIEIEHHPLEEPNKVGVAMVGPGGPRLRLGSKQGRVCLRRMEKEFKPRN